MERSIDSVVDMRLILCREEGKSGKLYLIIQGLFVLFSHTWLQYFLSDFLSPWFPQ